MHKQLKRAALTVGRVVLLALFLLAVVLPIYWMAATSFKTHTEIIDAQNLTYFPKTFTTLRIKPVPIP